MTFNLNNILGEYLSFLTSKTMRGGASPDFGIDIDNAKNINDLLCVIQYYFCFENAAGSPETEITEVELQDINIKDKFKLQNKTFDINTQYVENQMNIVTKISEFILRNNINGDQLKQVLNIGLKFSDLIRRDDTNPPIEALPPMSPYPPTDPILVTMPKPPPRIKTGLTQEIIDYTQGRLTVQPIITLTNVLDIDIVKINGITSGNPQYKINFSYIAFDIRVLFNGITPAYKDYVSISHILQDIFTENNR